jgi:hypothetical protein
MVKAAELAGIFDGHDIPDVFNNTNNGMVSFRAGTDRTDLMVRNIPAFRTINNLIPHFYDSVAKQLNICFVAF